MITLSILLIALVLYLIYLYINKKYTDFVLEHSMAIKEINELNEKYVFNTIPNFDMSHSYDNEVFFNNISTKDYLIYQLVFKKKEVRSAISSALENKKLYTPYISSVNNCQFNRYDTEDLPKIQKLLSIIEKNNFNSRIKKPITDFSIKVQLVQTKINDRYVDSKTDIFISETIEEIIDQINQKYDGRYLNDSIWQSICRVERGRVSNKMRFAIYERDGHRCKKCGRRTDDLEVDHIFPISKGGKSTFDNLQTLCHHCNTMKSNTVEAGVINPLSIRQGVKGFCPKCGASLVRKKGKYGDFYGCSNYPNCKFTKQIK